MATVIFHHGSRIEDAETAMELAKKSMHMGEEDAKWLYAAAIDRLQMKKGLKQKYGTQFVKTSRSSWKLYPVDRRVSDRARKNLNVMPLGAIREKVTQWNSEDVNPFNGKRAHPGITETRQETNAG